MSRSRPSSRLDAPTEVRRLSRQDLAAATGICARAMRDNPIHLLAFGAEPQRRELRLNRFFSGLLPYIHRRGLLMGACADDALIGVLGMLPPDRCMPTRLDVLRLLPALLTSHTPIGLFRVRRWLTAWAGSDLEEPHWHLGPLAVDPAHQGRGVGSRLMRHCLAHTAGSGAPLYLETDKPVNVHFYQAFGFDTLATLPVLGTATWLMQRDAPPQEPLA